MTQPIEMTVEQALEWLESLHGTAHGNTIGPGKWPEAQAAARAFRRQLLHLAGLNEGNLLLIRDLRDKLQVVTVDPTCCGNGIDDVNDLRVGDLAPDGPALPPISDTLVAIAAESASMCEWSQLSDEEPDTYETDCGLTWSFIDGGPKDNGVKFCPGCGKEAVEVPFVDPEQEYEA